MVAAMLYQASQAIANFFPAGGAHISTFQANIDFNPTALRALTDI